MGRRRRKTTPRRPIRTIPSIFNCPRCGRNAVRVELNKNIGQATIHCGNCDVQATIGITPLTEPVDVYGEFVDICAAQSTSDSKPQNSHLPSES
jgi:transcription elongation factor Elf1